MPSALVFDAYGTLYDVHSVQARCEALWPGKGAQLSQLWRTKQLEYTWQRTLMGRYVPFAQVTQEALEYSCALLGLVRGPEATASLMEEYRRLAAYPEVPAALARLSGHRKAILTNGSPDMIDPLVAHSGLAFDAVLSVDALKRYKPAPEVYQLAVDRLKLPKEHIAFVSSNCWDALGAKSFGFTVYWINRTKAPVDRLGFQPDQIVTGLHDVLAE
jgi:2-haloacid dehalogenase